MSYLQGIQAKAFRPGINCRGPEVGVIPFTYTVAAALVLNDVIGLCRLPAQHMPVGLFANIPDLDSNATPTIVLDLGFWLDDSETAPTVVDADALVDGSTAGQAGGRITAPNVATFLTFAPSDVDRIFGALVQVGPATGVATGTINGHLLVRGVSYDD